MAAKTKYLKMQPGKGKAHPLATRLHILLGWHIIKYIMRLLAENRYQAHSQRCSAWQEAYATNDITVAEESLQLVAIKQMRGDARFQARTGDVLVKMRPTLDVGTKWEAAFQLWEESIAQESNGRHIHGPVPLGPLIWLLW